MKIKKDEMKEVIFERALAMFGERGYEGVAMKDISDSLGISKGIVFYHYKRKDILYLACVEKFVNDFNNHLDEFCVKIKNVQMCDMGIKDVSVRQDFLLKYPQYARMFAEIIAGEQKSLNKEIKQLSATIFEHSKLLYENMLSGITLGKGISKEDATVLLSMLQYSLPDIISKENMLDRDGLMLRIFRIFINGLSIDLDVH